jgi:membrane AbrB-like protein
VDGVVIELALVLLAGGLGGLAGHRLRLPMGALLGAALGAGAARWGLGAAASEGRALQLVGQLLIGCALGSTLDREQLRVLGPARWLIAGTIAGFVALSAGLAYVAFYRPGHLDLVSAFLAAAPGGASESAATAVAVDAPVAVVVALHTMRMVLVSITLALVAQKVAGWGARSPRRGGMGRDPR